MALSDWKVIVGGQDMTAKMQPFLLDVEVVDRDGVEQDSCSITLDDTNGQLRLPKVRTPVSVKARGVTLFDGYVDSTPWSLSRGGGRVLKVSCKAFDTRGKASESQLWHLDDSDFSAAAKKAAGLAGFSVTVDKALASVQRSYWSPDGMSFIAWGEKMRKELGATFKMRGSKAVFAKRGGGMSAGGGAMPSVAAMVGRNVISVDIDPSKGRPRSKEKKVRWFDRKTASFKELKVSVDIPNPGEAIDVQRGLAADEGQAKTMADSQKTDAERNSGVGSVEMELAVQAQAEGTLVLSGARPGIDGSYRITGVTHRVDRGGGSTTRCELAQPQGSAGTDNR